MPSTTDTEEEGKMITLDQSSLPLITVVVAITHLSFVRFPLFSLLIQFREEALKSMINSINQLF